MAALIVSTVTDALNEAGITACTAYPGGNMPDITQVQATVSLEKLEYTARSATVLVTVMAPVTAGGSACEDAAIRVGAVLEDLGGVCVQEACRFDGYADTYCVRVLGTFRGSAVMEDWVAEAEFTVRVGSALLENAVAFQAEQAVDESTGEPLSTSVWNLRLEENFGWGEGPMPSAEEPFTVTVIRSGSTEIYSECRWISVQLQSTATGLRQVRRGVAKTRGFVVVG